jgi:hypothetical protein
MGSKNHKKNKNPIPHETSLADEAHLQLPSRSVTFEVHSLLICSLDTGNCFLSQVTSRLHASVLLGITRISTSLWLLSQTRLDNEAHRLLTVFMYLSQHSDEKSVEATTVLTESVAPAAQLDSLSLQIYVKDPTTSIIQGYPIILGFCALCERLHVVSVDSCFNITTGSSIEMICNTQILRCA